VRWLVVVVALFTLAYSLISLFHHWRFETSYDLAIFDQAIWHLARFETPESTVLGRSTIFADHFHPILILLAPLYWIAPAAETLLVVQAALFALSIVPVFLFLRRRLPQGVARALAVAYGLYWGLQRAAAADMHELAFAPLLIAVLIVAMDRRHWLLVWVAALLLMCVKEDQIPILVFAGLLLIGRGDRTQGAALTVVSLAAFVAVVRFIIPAMSADGGYATGSTYEAVLESPWRIPATLVSPPVKLETAFMWLAPFCFLSLRSPWSIMLIPLVLERFLSSSPNHWGTSHHYTAPIAPIVAMSAGDALARIASRMRPANSGTACDGLDRSRLRSALFPPARSSFHLAAVHTDLVPVDRDAPRRLPGARPRAARRQRRCAGCCLASPDSSAACVHARRACPRRRVFGRRI
jgi:uncharacterized membrane protein